MSSTTASVRRLTALTAAAAIALTGAALTAATPAHATGAPVDVAFDSIPDTLPANVVSVGFAAESTKELGDLIELEAGTSRHLASVEIGLSSWACETGSWNGGDCVSAPGATYSHPVTVTLYEEGAGGSVGAEIATLTKAVDVPFRPSASVECTAGRWFDGSNCSNGFLFTKTFPFTGDVVLPDRLIVGVSFETSRDGVLIAGGSYDALNVGLTGAVTAGADVDTTISYRNSSHASFYSDGGAAGLNVFRADEGLADYATQLITITTSEPEVVAPPKPTTAPETPATAADAIAASPNKVPAGSVMPGGSGSVPGGTLTFNIGAQNGNTWVYGTYFSDPTAVGWVYVSPNGDVTLPIPATLPAGTHTIVLVDASGNVVATVAGVSITALLAATGADPVEIATLAISGATLLVAGGILLVLRRRTAARA